MNECTEQHGIGIIGHWRLRSRRRPDANKADRDNGRIWQHKCQTPGARCQRDRKQHYWPIRSTDPWSPEQREAICQRDSYYHQFPTITTIYVCNSITAIQYRLSFLSFFQTGHTWSSYTNQINCTAWEFMIAHLNCTTTFALCILFHLSLLGLTPQCSERIPSL